VQYDDMTNFSHYNTRGVTIIGGGAQDDDLDGDARETQDLSRFGLQIA
jgi:hypothetical protein